MSDFNQGIIVGLIFAVIIITIAAITCQVLSQR